MCLNRYIYIKYAYYDYSKKVCITIFLLKLIGSFIVLHATL